MEKFLQLVANNALISSLIAAAILGLAGWGGKAWRDKRDGDKILGFLRSSKNTTGYGFRSTEAIAANTNIPESRVATICSHHRDIRRNEKEKQSWTLVE